MDEVELRGRILKWGNSYGIRLRKEDVQKLGLGAGSEARVTVKGLPRRIDVSRVRSFRSGEQDVGRRHDEVFAESAARDLEDAS